MSRHRWPVQPLLDLPGVSERDVYLSLHMSGTAWKRAVERGLDDWQADRAAIRLGYHPMHLWPDWVDVALGEMDRAFLAGGWRQAWLWAEQQALPLDPEVAA